MRRQTHSRWRTLTLGLVGTVLIGTLLHPTSATAATETVSGSTTIRVGLLLKSGSLNTATDTVTLSGRQGLQVGFYKQDGTFGSLYSTNTAAKISLDNYFIVLGESEDLTQAKALLSQAMGQDLSAELQIEQRSGKKIYQVIHGFFETRIQAEQVLAQDQAFYKNAVLKGYNRLTTGKLPDRQTAKTKAAELRAQGFDAYVLLRKDGSHEVWIGNEASIPALDTLRNQLQEKTGTTYTNADYTPADYLLLKTGYFNNQEIPYFIQNSTVEETAFVPQGEPNVIKVHEKAREYRGSILVQGYNEKPNVINRVPLAQYLYGVVPKEMSSGWPIEALKAQAVAARTYAVKRIGGKKWGVADIMDDVWDQAYYGYSIEAPDTNQAVDQTNGQVLTQNGQLIDALYSSNNGGYTGEVGELWGSKGIDYLHAVESPFDQIAAEREYMCYRVALPNGKIGWVRETNLAKTGKKNAAGFELAKITADDEPVRVVPDLYAKQIDSVDTDTEVIILGQEKEYNTYNWQRGPYSPTDIMNMINGNQANSYPTVSGPVYNLFVSRWGQGQRMLEVTADSTAITVPSPDYYRALFNDLWSTRATIEQQGTYTVLGANGQKSEYPNAKLQGKNLHVLSASGQTPTQDINGTNPSFVVLGSGGQSRVVTKEQSYIFHGNGWGHGLGMSQWGANGMAKNGYTYDQILQHYYQGVTITTKQLSALTPPSSTVSIGPADGAGMTSDPTDRTNTTTTSTPSETGNADGATTTETDPATTTD
ncbi:MAG TPA: SpoIID/LytB domain-containing protein [Bacilli bacterium]|nr:SpoIID/LytB domain-containing protein [Bacilli bacterium]